MESDSREYCKEMLPLVSRTFALGTSLLREPLFIQVAVSYLICRIADSIEDNAEVATEIRSGLLRKASKELCHDNRQELLDGIIKAFPEENATVQKEIFFITLRKLWRYLIVFQNLYKNL